VYCHEAMHVQLRMQDAGWSADVERHESDEDSDDSATERDADERAACLELILAWRGLLLRRLHSRLHRESQRVVWPCRVVGWAVTWSANRQVSQAYISQSDYWAVVSALQSV
jgi:hypothetical protein